MRAPALLLALCLIGQGALAEAPTTSLRPMPRGVSGAAAPDAAPGPVAAPLVSIRPMPRPVTEALADPTEAPSTAPSPVSDGGASILRPRPRPQGLRGGVDAAASAAEEAPEAVQEDPPTKGKQKAHAASTDGSVCGDPEIKGEVLAPIRAKVKGCGLDNPVRVTRVAGIRLNQAATLNCETAAALKTWINRGLRPAMGKREVVELRIAASYVCRSRNNQKGGKISEHGRGRAVDVAGFVFADGTQWSVISDYTRQMRKAHKAACGIFGTTLGPGSDGYHEDHLHFDSASYRSGPYCK